MTYSLSIYRILLALIGMFMCTAVAPAQTFREQAGSLLTSAEATGALLTLGILFLFLSILTMGTGVAEVCCFLCFTLLFGGRYLEGQELWIPMGLFVAGAAFAFVEVFVMSGLGIFGVLSMISFGGLSVILMDSPMAGLGIFSFSILLTVASTYMMIKFLPKFVVTRKFLILEPPRREGAPSSTKTAFPLVQAGDVGETLSTLRPVGSAMFGNQRVEVLSEGEFLKKGVPVEVVRVEGQKVVVRSCQV